jgi:hypothetical protein
MDTTDPWIRFNSRGECNHCSQFLAYQFPLISCTTNSGASLNQVQQLFSKIVQSRSPGSRFDVVVGVSGGVDSSTVALLASQYGLKVLAVHMDNGWDTPTAIYNINLLLNQPNIHYVSAVLDWNNFKAVQRCFLESGVADLELPTDIAIQRVLYDVATQYDIKYILSGGNIASEGILPQSWLYNARDTRYAKSVLRRTGRDPSIIRPLLFGFRRELKCRFLNRITTLYPLNFLHYDKSYYREQLGSTLGWRSYGGNHCESAFTRFTQYIYLPIRHSVDYRRASLSTQILLKKVSRYEALEILKSTPYSDLDIEREVFCIASKLDYTVSEIHCFLESKPFWFHDFDNSSFLLGIIYDLYRLMAPLSLVKKL